MENEFIRDPIKITVLGINNEKFYTKYTIIFIGNIPVDIKNEINKYPTKSNILNKFYGSDWKNKLGFTNSIGGNDNKLIEDIDIENKDVDLFDISNITGEVKHIDEVRLVEEIQEIQIHKKIPSLIFIDDIFIYPEDRISEFKEKIYLASSKYGELLPIYKQHVFITLRNTVIPIRYRLITDILVDIDITKLYKYEQKILDIPIDDSIYLKKDELKIEAYDYFITISDIYSKFAVNHFQIVNIDEVIKKNKQSLIKMTTHDKYQFELLYYSCIIKYWPMLDYNAFELYVTDEKNLVFKYPDLIPSISRLNKKYSAESKALNFKYELLGNDDKYPDFKDFNPALQTRQKHSKIDVSVKSATLIYKDIKQVLTDIDQIKINIRNLFGIFHTDETIPIIKVKLLIKGKPLVITKILNTSIHSTNTQKILKQVRYKLQIPYFDTILFVVKIPNDLIKIFTQNDTYLVCTIRRDGKYFINSSWEESMNMDFHTIFNVIQKTINPLITKINDLGRTIFIGIKKIPIITKYNTEFTDLHLSIFWKIIISRLSFIKLYDLLKQEALSNIIKFDVMVNPADSGVFEFNIIKGITELDIKQLERNFTLQNYYNYLTNSKIKHKWVSLFMNGRSALVTHRTTDIKIELSNMREKEFITFYQYFISLLYKYQDKISKNIIQDKIDISKQNVLKLLKSRDPELYDFKRFGSNIVYSRICHKNHQPLIYTEDEYKSMLDTEKNKITKYWNFTTDTPAYYSCPHKKFPYFGFITGHHPKGYCLACCKKNPSTNIKKSKKSYIYDLCMKKHIYKETDIKFSTSRYIMNYGKIIDIGRISKMPDIIHKYILYNVEDIDILNKKLTTTVFTENNKSYSISQLWKITRQSKIRKIMLIDLMSILKAPLWKQDHDINKKISIIDVVNDPKLSPTHYAQIRNAFLKYPILLKQNLNGTFTMIDGMHRLAKAYLKKSKYINARFVNQKQLDKAITGGASESTIEKKRPGHYLYGVPQNSFNVKNIGIIYSVAHALNMTFDIFIEKVIEKIKSNDNYFNLLFRGTLVNYFETSNNFINVLWQLFLSNELYHTKFSYWNELFIDIVNICFNKKIIILEDYSINIIGTNIKTSNITENIKLHLPIQISNVSDIIPDENIRLEEYILIFKKSKDMKSIFKKIDIYYPIFIFIPQTYFKSLKIEQKIYNNSSSIIKLLKNIIKDNLKTTTNKINNIINLEIINEFIKPIGVIKKLFINSKNMCYAILLEYKTNLIYLPINYSHYYNFDKSIIDYNPYYVKNQKTNYNIIAQLVRKYNKFIIEKTEQTEFHKIQNQTLEEREKQITTLYPLIKIDFILIYAPNANDKDNKVIGFKSNNFYYYFNEFAATNINIKEFIKKMKSGYNILNFKKTKIEYLFYNPDDINNILHNNNHDTILEDKLPYAIYNKYLYSLLMQEFMTYLDKDRNIKLRSYINKLIEKTSFNNADDLKEFRVLLRNKLINYPNDFNVLRDQINMFYNIHFNKNKLITEIDETIYHFDYKTLVKLKNLSTDYESVIDKKIIYNKIIKLVSDIIDKITIIGVPKFTQPIRENIFLTCKSNEPYCIKRKLIIPKDKKYDLIEILTADLLNPLKRNHILSSVYSNSIVEYFRFKKHINEDFYVKFS